MICSYFQLIYIFIEKIVIGNTQPAHDILRTYPKGLLKVLKSETCRGLSGNSQVANTKIDDFTKKLFFRNNSPSITYLQRYYVFDIYFFFFYRKWYVLGTSVGRRSNIIFKIQLTNTLLFFWQVTQDFIVNGNSEKFSEEYNG